MTSVLKEYGFVAVSIIGALFFFVILRYILYAQNENSIVNAMQSSVQYTGDNYGMSSRTNLGELQEKIPWIKFKDDKDYDITNTYVPIWHTTDPENKDNQIAAVPPVWTFPTAFMLDGVSIQYGNGAEITGYKNVQKDIELTVIDYTPKIEQAGSNKINTITGKVAAPEEVIAVDKYGNKIYKDDGITYETTTRMAYEHRDGSDTDSTQLGADEYYSKENNIYYGSVYFYKYNEAEGKGVWYEDKDNDGKFTDATIDTPITKNAVGSWTGVDFNTDLPHKFKVIYRLTDNMTEGNSLKTEQTKLFLAKPREQQKRSIDVWGEVYDKVNAGEPVDPELGPEEVETNTDELERYEGTSWEELYDDRVKEKFNQLIWWQNANKDDGD